MNAILAIDSFKGCLSSHEAERAASLAFGPDDEFILIPVSDGGEGFSRVVTEAAGGEFRSLAASDPLGRSVQAGYGLIRDGRTAVIETASASGLTLIPEDLRDPMKATSYGTGELMADALDNGVEEIFLGLGGSATNDGGTGMLQALGYRLVTPGGFAVPGRAVMSDIIGIDSSGRHPGLKNVRIYGFYDVDVPFCGPGGATDMFSAQKGAGPETAEALEGWMRQLGAVYSSFSGKNAIHSPGAGAAGGIGGALYSILHAGMEQGTERVLDMAGMGISIDMGFDVIITGEGKADMQTLTGKVPKGVLDYVRRHDRLRRRKPCEVYLIAGAVRDREELLSAGFDRVIQTSPDGIPAETAMDRDYAAERIRMAVESLIAG